MEQEREEGWLQTQAITAKKTAPRPNKAGPLHPDNTGGALLLVLLFIVAAYIQPGSYDRQPSQVIQRSKD